MAARDEGTHILQVLSALGAQTLLPALVVVVDDGSTDGTGDVLAKASGGLGYALRVVTLPHHEASYVGRPELARVLNQGLRVIRAWEHPVEFVVLLGGDHALPHAYFELLAAKMREDPLLAVASGYIAGERFEERSPRGSGMMVRAKFWNEANGLRFPLEYGWESYLYLRAQSMGLHTRSFRDVVSRVSRPTSMKKGALYGRGMYALGYFWVYALGRCLTYAPHSPLAAAQMWRGYVDHRGVGQLDISPWVNRSQKGALLRRGAKLLLRRGLNAPPGLEQGARHR